MDFAAPIVPLARVEAERLQQAGMVRKARYVGFLRGREHEVWACTMHGITQLRPRSDLIPVAPIAFGWGDSSPGSLHVAGAVLSHWSGADEFALRNYRAFAEHVIRHLNQPVWEMTTSTITRSIAQIALGRKSQL
jgi:hypothetical protein